ncbi:MAG: F0F1 ATP synthase subunit alpha [Candidatus Calescibacterium sp.]|nr:F0F1 ATP synthase subunit alpha [Candidatus Calescibacterium sp.]MCX7972540.1 F0F1 ATP synthase subunit alpha [bacterium]MDW8195567.1 F0F1 ATP synthase subunit alpha [Candidatus Calescibacterium sp.]
MAEIRIDELSEVIKKQIESFQGLTVEQQDIGTVLQVGDNVVLAYGLRGVKYGEIIDFGNDRYGLAFDLQEESVGILLLGNYSDIYEGDIVKKTNRVLEIPVGESLIGRVVNPLSLPLDGKGEIIPSGYRPLEALAPGVVDRKPVEEPLYTGIKAIDMLIPIGKGQRELIIGDRQTGKSSILIDTIINQKGRDVICIYVSIGQKASYVSSVIQTLEKYGAMDYTIVVSTVSTDVPSLLYLAPYAGCAMGEYFMYKGKHVLVVYDDLTKHAHAYREISLLLRRPPGREAYPGDVFYLHSRLLERAAKLNDSLGGGSLTALPVIETQLGDVSAYIPTNVISITDGQIYLDSNLFNKGFRPAIDVGLSVSRVGGAAQTKATKQVAAQLKLDLAMFRELESFTKFASELDEATRKQIIRGQVLMELLKQDLHQVMPIEEQILSIFVGTKGFLDDIPLEKIRDFEAKWLEYCRANKKHIIQEIQQKQKLSEESIKELEESAAKFKQNYLIEQKIRQ